MCRLCHINGKVVYSISAIEKVAMHNGFEEKWHKMSPSNVLVSNKVKKIVDANHSPAMTE